MLKDATTLNGYKLNENGKLIINDVVYQVSFWDVVNFNVAIFLNKKESVDELTKGFEIDYNQVFSEWYIKSKTNITNQLNSIANNLTVQKVNKVCDEISKRVKECKQIGVWYNEKLLFIMLIVLSAFIYTTPTFSDVIGCDSDGIVCLNDDLELYSNEFIPLI